MVARTESCKGRVAPALLKSRASNGLTILALQSVNYETIIAATGSPKKSISARRRRIVKKYRKFAIFFTARAW
jgi:hypothetical protein